MKYQDQFFFLTQANTISIPGKFPIRTAVQTVTFNQASRFDEVFLTSDEQMILFQTAYKGKLLKNLEHRHIPGSDHNFPWQFQYARSKITQNRSEPIMLVRADVQGYMDRLLWQPLQNLICRNLKQYEQVHVELPILPTVFQASFLKKWYANNRAAERFFLRPRKIAKGYNRCEEQARVQGNFVRES